MRTADAVMLMSLMADQKVMAMMQQFVDEFVNPVLRSTLNDYQRQVGIDWMRSVMGRCPVHQTHAAFGNDAFADAGKPIARKT